MGFVVRSGHRGEATACARTVVAATLVAVGFTTACGEAEYPVALPPPPPPPALVFAGGDASLGYVPSPDGGNGIAAVPPACSADVEPYVTATETGTRVLLSPDRYVLYPHTTGVTTDQGVSVWHLVGSAPSDVDYDISDRVTGEMVIQGHATLRCTRTYAHVFAPQPGGVAPPFQPAPPGHLDDGTYVGWNIFGGALTAAGAGFLVGGIASMIESAGGASTDSSAETRGIVLIDLAPHVLTAGIVALAMNASAHSRAKARAGIAEVPFIVPLRSGGAVGGLGGVF